LDIFFDVEFLVFDCALLLFFLFLFKRRGWDSSRRRQFLFWGRRSLFGDI
jgi:hypothetical protein